MERVALQQRAAQAEHVLRAATVRPGMAIVNGQHLAEAWTYGRPETRPSLLRLVVETMRGQERMCSRFRCTLLTQSARA